MRVNLLVRVNLGEEATYPDHVFYNPAGGYCVLFYQFRQVIESGRWGEGRQGEDRKRASIENISQGHSSITSSLSLQLGPHYPSWTPEVKPNNPCVALQSLKK